MNQKAIIDNILLQNIEQKVGASGYPYSVLTIQISQPGKQGQVDVAQTEVVSGKQEILAVLQVGATYSMEFEPRVGKPNQQTGRRFLNLELKGVRQTGGSQQAFDNPAAYNQAPAPQNYNQAPQYQQPQYQQPQQQQMQQPAPIQQAPAQQQGMAPPPAQQGFAPQGEQNNSAPEDFSDDIPF